MSVKKALAKEGLILAGFLVTALSLFVFLEKRFPDKLQLHFKIALCVFIVLYAGRWAIRIFKGLLLIFFIAAAMAIFWILFKLS